jgi:pimeloyl-ACP methyl ester carboxylesterase
VEELMRLGFDDAVLKIHRPVVDGAAEEFRAAFEELRRQLGLDAGPIGVLGGSIGSAVAQLVLAEGQLEISAAVLVSPDVQLRRAVEAMGRRYGVSYAWSDESNAVAERLDFVARAGELARSRPAVLLVVGERDDAGIREPASELAAALDLAELVTVPDMEHALAEEPGVEPAPQTPHAAAVDRLAVQWFRRHLTG